MLKLKRCLKKPWIRCKCSKKRALLRFSVASSKFCGKRRIPQRGVKIHVPWNTAGPDHLLLLYSVIFCVIFNQSTVSFFTKPQANCCRMWLACVSYVMHDLFDNTLTELW